MKEHHSMSLSDVIGSAASQFTTSTVGSTLASSAVSGGLSFLGSKLASVAGPGALGTLGAGMAPGNDLAGIQARSDPLLSFCWYAQLPTISPTPTSSSPVNQNSPSTSLGSSLMNGISSLAGSAINSLGSTLGGSLFSSSSATSIPWYYVEEAVLPFRNFGVKSIFRDGRHRHYADTYSVDNLTLHFYLDSSNTALQYLQAWQNAIIAPFSANNSATSGGGFGRPAQYKQPVYIYILDVTKAQMAIVEYTECWPTNLSALNLDSSSSNRLTGIVPFSVGDVFVNIVGVAQSLVQGVLANPSQFKNLASAAAAKTLGNTAGSISSSITSLI
jgi:hypothetical protein